MKNSIIGRTGQWWKVIIGFVALLVGSIAPLFESSGISVMSGTVLAVVGYGYTVAMVRCPACGEPAEAQFTQCWRCGATRSVDP